MHFFARPIDFELFFRDWLRRQLQLGKLGFSPNSAVVYHRREYHSRDRDANIVVDVALEVFHAHHRDSFLLWAWECKDLTRKLDVAELEEFNSKVQQIAGLNVKAGIATTSELQRAARVYAQKRRISVVRLRPPLPSGGWGSSAAGPDTYCIESALPLNRAVADRVTFAWDNASAQDPFRARLLDQTTSEILAAPIPCDSLSDLMHATLQDGSTPDQRSHGSPSNRHRTFGEASSEGEPYRDA